MKAEALIELKGPAEVGWMREAGRATAETLQVLAQAAQTGVSAIQNSTNVKLNSNQYGQDAFVSVEVLS